MWRVVLLVLLLSGCATTNSITKEEQLISVEEVANCTVPPILDIPPSLDLSKYKLDENVVKILTLEDKSYVAIPEQDVIKQQELLLVLKNRILELQTIISNAKNLL